jgi:drug/metabolite transporter (DMT)-like permease
VAILSAAVCYAISTILARRLATLDALVSAATVMWITSAIMFPVALWMDRPWDQDLTVEAIASVVWLGLFATALATIFYFRVIQSAGPTFLSLMNYLIPVVALTAGAVVLDEEPAGTILTGLVLILTGLAISQLGGRARPAR